MNKEQMYVIVDGEKVLLEEFKKMQESFDKKYNLQEDGSYSSKLRLRD